MKISTRGRYALRMMIDLGQNQKDSYITLKEICERQNISLKYLEQIVSVLAKAKLVKSLRGPQGGYLLAKPANKYIVGDILRTIEGDFELVSCVKCHEDCERIAICATSDFWKDLSKTVNDFLDSKTLQDLIDETNAKEAQKKIKK